jgi:16S rRNA (cytosine967-C5)-methyltransferase
VTGLNESHSVRQLASEILFKVESQKAYADILLDRALRTSGLNERDRALLTELTYGTLRWRGKIDARLCQQLSRPLRDTDGFVRNLLRVTIYQLLFLDKIPDYAAVNEAVELAKCQRGGSKTGGFVNGVLRNLLRRGQDSAVTNEHDNSIAALAVEYSHPEWLVSRWIEEYGQREACALMLANNQRAPLVLRVNRRQCAREELLGQLLTQGFTAATTPWSPDGIMLESGGAVENLPGFADGLFQVQGESSQLLVYLLAPSPGERILDACAAPGGKTTHIAEVMNGTGELISLDNSPRGIERIRENIARLRLTSIQAVRADATNQLAGALSAPYDRILVDAPCSGLGTLRSHPEIKWQRRESDIQRLSELQMQILENVASYLKPGGILVYSTCTLTREENDSFVENFLARHKQFELADAAGYLPNTAKHMVRDRYFQALPQRDNTDGFFAARMRKGI